jgi:hypothetical protein
MALALMFVLLAPTAIKTNMLVQYFWDLETYKELCTNRAQPDLLCNGSCIFAAELNAVEAAPEAPTFPESLRVELLPFVNLKLSLTINIGQSQLSAMVPVVNHFANQFFHEIPVPPPLGDAHIC